MNKIWVLERLEDDDKWWPFQHGIGIDSRSKCRELKNLNQEIWPFGKFRVKKYVQAKEG